MLTSVQMMMSYLYCGGTESLKKNVPDLLEVRPVSGFSYISVIYEIPQLISLSLQII